LLTSILKLPTKKERNRVWGFETHIKYRRSLGGKHDYHSTKWYLVDKK